MGIKERVAAILILASLSAQAAQLDTNHLKGRLVFTRGGSLLTYDFSTKKERLLLARDFQLPRWSPDGRLISGKSENSVLVIDAEGRTVSSIEGIQRNAIVHWVNPESLLIMVDHPRGNPKVGRIREADRKSGMTAEWMYAVYGVGSKPEDLEWRLLYGGGAYLDMSLRTREQAASALDKLPPRERIACTVEPEECVVKSVYPYLLPQRTALGLALVMAARPEEGVNILLKCEPDLIHRVFTPASSSPMLMLEPKPMWVDPNSGYSPSWSPNGKFVAYSAGRGDSGAAIFLLPGSGKKESDAKLVLRRTSNRKSWKGGYLEGFNYPRWSPDSRFIATGHRKPLGLNPLSEDTGHFVNIFDTESGRQVDLMSGWEPDWTGM